MFADGVEALTGVKQVVLLLRHTMQPYYTEWLANAWLLWSTPVV